MTFKCRCTLHIHYASNSIIGDDKVLHSHPNQHTSNLIISSIGNNYDEYKPDLRSKLDSHANMIVLGSNAYIFDDVFERTCDFGLLVLN